MTRIRRDRFGQQDADRIAELCERLAHKMRQGDLVAFYDRAADYAARGYPTSTINGGSTSSGDTLTERAATTSTQPLDDAGDRGWTAMTEAIGNLHALERLMALVLHQAQPIGRASSVEQCAACNEPITGVGADRVKRLDGKPYHAGSCWWSTYNATRGRRGA